MFFTTSYFASLANSSTRLRNERCGTAICVLIVIVAISISPLSSPHDCPARCPRFAPLFWALTWERKSSVHRMIVLRQRQERFFQSRRRHFQGRQPFIALQQFTDYRLRRLHLHLEPLPVSGYAQHARDAANLLRAQLARKPYLLADRPRFDLSRAPLGHDVPVLQHHHPV